MNKGRAQIFWQSCENVSRKKQEISPYETVARNALREWAKEDGQATVAGIIGFTPQYINDIIHGRRGLTVSFLSSAIERVTW